MFSAAIALTLAEIVAETAAPTSAGWLCACAPIWNEPSSRSIRAAHMGSPSIKQNEKLSDDEMIKTLVMFFFCFYLLTVFTFRLIVHCQSTAFGRLRLML